MSEQHDDHIWLTVFGSAWAIKSISGSTFWLWRVTDDMQYALIDISDVDWDSYCDAAVRMLEERA